MRKALMRKALMRKALMRKVLLWENPLAPQPNHTVQSHVPPAADCQDDSKLNATFLSKSPSGQSDYPGDPSFKLLRVQDLTEY